jgi:hypothetical protein
MPRTASEISDSLHQRLNSYALAASAAGVSLLALAHPAEAKIVYTPAHVVIPEGGRYFLDVNHDGITDFGIYNYSTCDKSSCWPVPPIIVIEPRSGHHLFNFRSQGIEGKILELYALTRGKLISSQKSFVYGGGMSTWPNHETRYAGLQFQIKNHTHYGWARLRVDKGQQYTVYLTGYAYETIPNKPIVAGKTRGHSASQQPTATAIAEPTALGLLASGWRGLPLWRH